MKEESNIGTIAMWIGIASIILSFIPLFGWPAAIAGVITGIIGAAKLPNGSKGFKRSIIGIVTSIVGGMLSTFIFLIAMALMGY